LKFSYIELISDLGGQENLGVVKRTLAEKFVWLSAILQGIELRIAEGGKKDQAELLGRWVQGLNSLSGLARMLGIERKRRMVDLKAYVKSKSSEDNE